MNEVRWVDKGEKGEVLVSIGADGRINEWSLKKGLDYLSTAFYGAKLYVRSEAIEDGDESSKEEGGTSEENVYTHEWTEYRLLFKRLLDILCGYGRRNYPSMQHVIYRSISGYILRTSWTCLQGSMQSIRSRLLPNVFLRLDSASMELERQHL